MMMVKFHPFHPSSIVGLRIFLKEKKRCTHKDAHKKPVRGKCFAICLCARPFINLESCSFFILAREELHYCTLKNTVVVIVTITINVEGK